MGDAANTITKMKGNPLFALLPSEGLAQLADHSRIETFSAGEKLIEENGKNRSLFLLTLGEAKIVSNGTEVDRQKAGDTAGEVSMSKISPPVADVIAVSDVEAILFPSEVIDEVSARYPDFSRQLRETAMKKVYDR
ncbi:Cyclic nucleotide-binding domain-containing protein [Mariprofundus aestuarium]|uniref:Cyclic nucleotide-binding domain-containing protein n=1 Tax=Mariprofundus aestuarium TaxID=1921086 RepID=A0A2K8KWY3_MARES|nr:cyclic nucleotide-binding domain-containing protein [Mariprofundus aestuarium]ATX79430.1 Cyclic nucleotide-binding domain-containing protein [Mariprofundus aestuarium]